MSDTSPNLSFAAFREANVLRCESAFHPLHSWSLGDWAIAMAGEAGEACNIVKKIKRMEDPQGHAATKQDTFNGGDAAALHQKLADELADVVTYADLMAASRGIDLGAAVAAKFNKVSERVGSPIRL